MMAMTTNSSTSVKPLRRRADTFVTRLLESLNKSAAGWRGGIVIDEGQFVKR